LTTAACAAAWRGDFDLARSYQRRLQLLARDELFVSSLNLALIHVALGESSDAMAALRHGLTRRDPWLVFLDVHPLFEPLRSRSDFNAIRSQVCQSSRSAK